MMHGTWSVPALKVGPPLQLLQDAHRGTRLRAALARRRRRLGPQRLGRPLLGRATRRGELGGGGVGRLCVCVRVERES